MSHAQSRSFTSDFFEYVGRFREFGRDDWLVYIAWIGLMLGLLFSVSGFLTVGSLGGVEYPTYVWNIPFGAFFFVGAIAIDTVGHRTVYKGVLREGEALVHHITIFAGIASVLALCLAFRHRELMRVPAAVMIALSVLYSVIDEAMHWRRYLTLKSDRVEMWSHFFILFGHLVMIASWWHWFDQGYPGVAETLSAMEKAFE